MANILEDIQSVGSDTRPPMLDRSDFASWQQRIRLYCMGKDNGENIIKSIDEGPFKMGKFKETLAEGVEGALHLGPERDRVVADLTPEEKDRYKADIRSELMKDDRESQLHDEFKHFRQNKRETIHEYYDRFTKLINDMRNIKMTMPKMQLNSKFVNNMLLEWGRFVTVVKLNRGLKESNYDQLYAYLKQHEAHATKNKMMFEKFTQHSIDPLALMSNVSPPQGQGNNARGAVAAGNGAVQTELATQILDKMLLMQAHENGVVLDEEQLLFIAGGQDNAVDADVDERPCNTPKLRYAAKYNNWGATS
ncbi:retrovirus-related pol polyprotein from transposon TNT 1-94 [Tanacetum coccineum]|uniref:Retrovirus-related pol polyprotein from transposon TNT 1-94 n=1 Tax=Tanacetum coccineum TaxID=301880 RepID=A0ABQ5INQ2_9ASTR